MYSAVTLVPALGAKDSETQCVRLVFFGMGTRTRTNAHTHAVPRDIDAEGEGGDDAHGGGHLLVVCEVGLDAIADGCSGLADALEHGDAVLLCGEDELRVADVPVFALLPDAGLGLCAHLDKLRLLAKLRLVVDGAAPLSLLPLVGGLLGVQLLLLHLRLLLQLLVVPLPRKLVLVLRTLAWGAMMT